jgi:hypothetical protein
MILVIIDIKTFLHLTRVNKIPTSIVYMLAKNIKKQRILTIKFNILIYTMLFPLV